MQCIYCNEQIAENSSFCNHCGKKQTKNQFSILIGIAIVLLVIAVATVKMFFPVNDPKSALNEPSNIETFASTVENVPKEMTDDEHEKEKSRIGIIEEAQATVYTLYTDDSQGSAFLYDEKGSVITNAHVVEGSHYVVLTTNDGQELSGKVIGYSNETDIAIVHVPELIGKKPFPLEKNEPSKVGEEVVALGSPLGYANTATIGYITGIDRNFNIPPHTFSNVYQTSASIEPGNSGGPLVSVHNEKIVAINSAKHMDANNIAFSIPLYQIIDLVDQWITNPLSEDEIAALFYDNNGNYYYEYLWTLFDDYYFDGGDYTDEEDQYYYWYYDEDYDYYDNDYEDYYDDSWDHYWDDDFWYDYWDDFDWEGDYWEESDWDDGYWDDYDDWDMELEYYIEDDDLWYDDEW